MIYRNIREFQLALENATTGQIVYVQPNQTIELPESFAAFYSNVLQPIHMRPPVIETTPMIHSFISERAADIFQDEPHEELVKEDESTFEILDSKTIEEPVKKGRGRPKKT